MSVLVFFLPSECPRGYFGDECSEKCSDNCYGCNNINGVCDSGCKPGWRGGFCHEGLFIYMVIIYQVKCFLEMKISRKLVFFGVV